MSCCVAQVPAALGHQLTAHGPVSSGFVVFMLLEMCGDLTHAAHLLSLEVCQSYCPSQYCLPSPNQCDSTSMLAMEQPNDAFCQNRDFFGQVNLQLGEILDLAPETVVSVLMQVQKMRRML